MAHLPGFLFRASGLVLAHSASHSPCDEKAGPAKRSTGAFRDGLRIPLIVCKRNEGFAPSFLLDAVINFDTIGALYQGVFKNKRLQVIQYRSTFGVYKHKDRPNKSQMAF